MIVTSADTRLPGFTSLASLVMCTVLTVLFMGDQQWKTWVSVIFFPSSTDLFTVFHPSLLS